MTSRQAEAVRRHWEQARLALLARHAERAGVKVRLEIFPGMQHTFQMAAGRAPEADEAIRSAADWLRA
jgi:acetyl esterase/lipase